MISSTSVQWWPAEAGFMTRRVAGLAVTVICVSFGGEAQPVGPKSITGVSHKEKQTLTVDWGSVGPAIARSPKECDHDRQAVYDYLDSPAFKEFFATVQRDAHVKERVHGEAVVARAKAEYETKEQPAARPRAIDATTTRHPLAPWMERIPQSLRGQVNLLVVDFSDTQQIAWAITQVEKTPGAQLIVVGWRSQAEVDALVKRMPNLAKSLKLHDRKDNVKATDRWLSAWNIRVLPARVSIEDDQVVVQEGVLP